MNLDGGIHEIPLGDLGDLGGRLWLCGKHVAAPEPDALLRRLDAHAIVCLTERHELIDRYPGYVRWLESDPRATWFPVHDLAAPDPVRARPFLDGLLSRLRVGERMVVHCAAGIGRAGTTAAALLVLDGWRVDDALAHVRTHRPMAGPEGGAQLDLVRHLAAAIHRDRDADPAAIDSDNDVRLGPVDTAVTSDDVHRAEPNTAPDTRPDPGRRSGR